MDSKPSTKDLDISEKCWKMLLEHFTPLPSHEAVQWAKQARERYEDDDFFTHESICWPVLPVILKVYGISMKGELVSRAEIMLNEFWTAFQNGSMTVALIDNIRRELVALSSK